MELLSRPPQRRKHSTATTTAFPVKSPYDDVLVARGGRGSPLEAHEYTEIFSGSSSAPPSIPVLDLSSLDERAVLGDFRVPVQDYSSIFGGLRNDDAAAPYQDLFGGFAKRAKPLRKSPDLSSPLQRSSPLHASENTKSNGKSRGIQSPLQHPGSLRPSESTKKLVGKASNQSVEGGKQQINASFSSTNRRDSDAVNRKMHIAEPHSVSGFTGIADGILQQQKADNHKPVPHSFESYSSKKPPSSSSPEKSSDAKDPKEDVFKKSAVGYSLPFLDEELDENSVAAASAAALKKAIEQAQESIRVAKMLRGRKNEGRRERFKTRSSDDGEDLDKESKMPHDEYEEAGSTFWADFDQNDAVTKAGNVGSVPEKVEVAEGRSEEVERGSKLFTSDGSQSEEKAQLGKNVENAELTRECREELATRGGSFASLFHKGENVHVGEKVQLEMNGENVEAAKGHGEDPESAATLVFSDSEEIHFREKVQPDGAESTEIDREKPSASHRMQDPADTVEEIEKSDATEDIFEPVERVLDTPQSTTAAKVVDEDAEKKISLEAKLDSLSKNNTDEHGMKFEECDELQNVEDLTEFESGFIDFSITTNHVIGRVLFEQEVVEKEAENVPCGEETEHGNEEENGMRWEDVRLSFESKALEEEIGDREYTPEMEEADKKIETREPEIDTDWRPANETVELKLPQELDPDNDEERPNRIREHEAAESRTLEANGYVEIQKDEAFWDMEETNITSEETGRSVEDGNIRDYEEVVYDDDSDEAVDSNTLAASEVRETCVIDSNGAPGPYQKTVNSNVEHGTVPEETEAEIEDDAEAEPMFDQETELPAVASLHRSASEGILLDGKQQNVFEGLSSDGKAENVIGTDSSDSKENLSEDEDAFEAADEIYGGKQKQEFNLTDAKPVLEQTSESDQGSESTCSLDNIDQFSAHESEGDAEKDQTSSKEEFVPKDDKFMEAERTEEKSSSIEKEDPIGNFVMGDKNAEKVVENSERQQRIEAIKKAREQEKDRLVVERAIREARERAFAEARERAARAAAEKTESCTTEAQKKLDKTSTEAKFRAERAAVERATAEARERALEKALSMKTPSESRADSGLKHSFSSSDLENSTYTESARRRQARLERHQRIMERAAKALAEKNMRDILAQKEQAERNRLAESLDAEIKRWVSGKEGNLRALLSTLQYILGRDSGWQPIPLTEVVTTAAVKKAYRKATLYVHPDKLQQRGASIQQKYICEKVFDLLKAAWNRFNSEER